MLITTSGICCLGSCYKNSLLLSYKPIVTCQDIFLVDKKLIFYILFPCLHGSVHSLYLWHLWALPSFQLLPLFPSILIMSFLLKQLVYTVSFPCLILCHYQNLIIGAIFSLNLFSQNFIRQLECGKQLTHYNILSDYIHVCGQIRAY